MDGESLMKENMNLYFSFQISIWSHFTVHKMTLQILFALILDGKDVVVCGTSSIVNQHLFVLEIFCIIRNTIITLHMHTFSSH